FKLNNPDIINIIADILVKCIDDICFCIEGRAFATINIKIDVDIIEFKGSFTYQFILQNNQFNSIQFNSIQLLKTFSWPLIAIVTYAITIAAALAVAMLF